MFLLWLWYMMSWIAAVVMTRLCWRASAAGARRRAGVVFFSVGRVHAPPPSAWLSPRPHFPSRVSFMRSFFASCCVLVRRPAACAVYVADRPRGVTPDAAPERR